MTPTPHVQRLRDARRRLQSVLVANADRLSTPFTDFPDKNPWDTYVRPAMRELKNAVDAIAAPAAVPVAAPPTTEQAEARCAVCHRPGDDSHPAACFPPAPADRAAALREAADRYEEILANADTGQDPRYWTAVRDITLGLRAMADEAGQAGGPSRETTEPQPEPTTEEIACANVLALHQIGEQLAGIESWMWEHLADVRDAAKAQPDARPRCPDCQMPHDLTPGMALACASIRASIAERDAAEGTS